MLMSILILWLVILIFIFSIRVNYKILALIFILAAYINLVKPIFGTRYAPLLIDLIIAFLFIRIFLNKALLRGNSLFRSQGIEIPLLLFFVISLIEIFNPNVPTFQMGLEGFRKTTYQMLAIYLGIYYIKNRLEVEKVCKYICYTSIPLLLYGIKQFIFFSAFDQRIIDLNQSGSAVYNIGGAKRAISIFSGPFHFGMFSCLIALFSLHFYLKRRELFYLTLFIVSVVGVFINLTRVNVLALTVSSMFLLWFERPVKRRLLKKLNVFFLLSLVIIVIISSEIFTSVLWVFESLRDINTDERFLMRFPGYGQLLDAFISNPFMGYGMGSAGDTLENIYEWKVHFTSHNMFLKIMIETGLFGLTIYLIFFLIWFKKALDLLRIGSTEVRNLSVLIISIVLILLVNGLSGSSVEAYPVNMYIWFFAGVLVKIWLIERENTDEKAHAYKGNRASIEGNTRKY